jgi:hypothetical protein
MAPSRLGRKYSTNIDSSRARDDFQRKVELLNLARYLKARVYPLLPSLNLAWHQKRRKGLAYRYSSEDDLECQQVQDRLFWSHFLKPVKEGKFLEISGDGVVGSHTLGLELKYDWMGAIWAPSEAPRLQAKRARKCSVIKVGQNYPIEAGIELLAIHRPAQFPWVYAEIAAGQIDPRWVVIENREGDPQWTQLLEASGYKLKFFYHDDEYFEREANKRVPFKQVKEFVAQK